MFSLGVHDLGLDLDPVLRFGHVRAFWISPRAKMIFTYISIGICAYGLIPNPAKILNIRHDDTLSIRNFEMF
jgi:hypothetical protein